MAKSSAKSTKVCNKCGEEKPLSTFNKNQAMCRPCQKVYKKAWREANREKVNSDARRYSNEHRGERRESTKTWREEHREERREYDRKYYAEHREERREYVRMYRSEHREKNPLAVYVRNKLASGKARTLEVGGEVCCIPWRDAARLLRAPCARCGGKADSLDHLIPTSRGGRHSIGNLVALCVPCNASKGNKTWIEWRVWQLRLCYAA